MQKIIPHLWFAAQAKEAAEFYVTLFDNSSVDTVTVITDTPSGDCDVVSFTLAGSQFMAISAGPVFIINPSISFYVSCDSEDEANTLWSKLIEGGFAMMDYAAYPWAQKYGWLKDRFGVSWQISWSTLDDRAQKITPMLMFTQDGAGRARDAIEKYVSVFPDSGIDVVVPYEEGDGDTPGFIKHSRFHLCGQKFMAIESSGPHEFVFNEAVSFIVRCNTQEEIDTYSDALSAVPEAEQCGWLKDAYGVSWQITPAVMDEMMACGDNEKIARVTQAFLPMKRFDIAAIERAFKGK